jgi:hypothetical protein
MSAWEQVSSTYTEAATKALPLHRAVVFFTGFLVSLAVQQQTHLSLLETLAVVPLADFFTLDKGLLAKATFGNVFWAILATFAGVAFSKVSIRLAYGLVDRATGLSAKAAGLDKSWLSGLSIEERISALELLESGLIEPRARLRAFSGLSELLGGVGIIFFVATVWGNRIDGTVGTVALIGAFISQLVTIFIFLSDYYGPAMAKAHLQGRLAPNIEALN